MTHSSTKQHNRTFLPGLWLAVLMAIIPLLPVQAAPSNRGPVPLPSSSSGLNSPRYAAAPLLSFSAPDISLAFGSASADYSLVITNTGAAAAESIRLYVDFGAVTVTASNATYTTGADPYFTLANLAAGASFTLDFTLSYTSWCTDSDLDRDLIWRTSYQDSLGNTYAAGTQASTLTVTGQPALQISLTGGQDNYHIWDVGVYHLESSYSGATSCASGSMGHVKVDVTVPEGFTLVDGGGGSWTPAGVYGGGVLTFSYTQPATLSVDFSLQANYYAPCGTAITTTAAATCTDCGTSVPSASASRTSASVCSNTTSSGKTVSPSPCPRCGDLTYTNTYTFPGGVVETLNELRFTDLAEKQQAYKLNSLTVNLSGADITTCPTMTDSTPGGTFKLDFSGCPTVSLASKSLTITYTMETNATTGTPCTDLDFYSNSELSGVGDIVYSSVPVHVDAPNVTAAISGLGSTVAVGETKSVTVTLTANNAFTRDASFTLSDDNYVISDPFMTTCSGAVSPTNCIPIADASGYHWYFADGFDTAGWSAILQFDVKKLSTLNANLDGAFSFDEHCQDDGSYDNACSTTASASPALLTAGDVSISIEPAVYSTTGKDIQWKTYVTNQGTGPAYNVYVDHVLGAGLNYVSSTVDDMTGVTTIAGQDHTGAAINGAVTLISELAPGARLEITVNAYRTAKTNLSYAATAAWGFNGTDAQTPVTDSATVDLLPLIVTNANDSGPGSLRQIVADAESGDTITFAGDFDIYLDSQIDLNKSLTIDGGTNSITVSGDSGNNGSANVRVFNVTTGSVVNINHLSIMDGSANYGAGIYNYGTLTLQDCTLTANTASIGGGAIWNESGIIKLVRTTVYGNVSEVNGGGILSRYGTATVENSTVSGNNALANGGGIESINGTLNLTNTTIAGNASSTGGGGLYHWGGTLSLRNTIIANSTGGDCELTGGGAIAANVNNLIEDGSCSNNGVGFLTGDPSLGSLSANGGLTLTHALLPGSLAIESGDNATCLATDQRGTARPQMARCDIGAYEADPQPVLRLTKSVSPTTVAYAGGEATYTIVVQNDGTMNDPSVTLTDTLPDGMTFNAWVTNPGATVSGNQISWNGMIASGGSITLVFTATHSSGLTNTNTVTVTDGNQTLQASATTTSSCPSALVVTNDADSGTGSLRQAIADVCTGGTITFAGNYTIHLSQELYPQNDMTIDGTGRIVTVDGDGANRVFYVGANVVTINHLTITNGNQAGGGGGLMLYNGTLNLLNSTVSDNTSNDPVYAGGGIYNSGGILNVTASTISGNTAINSGGSGDAGSGGAIHNSAGTVTITNSTISGNNSSNASGGASVGGIYSDSGSVTLLNTTIAGNSASATNGGSVIGGIYKTGSQMTVSNSILAGNQSDVNCSGSFNLTGMNIEWGISGASSTCTGFVKSNPLLSALGDYGGATQTMALLPGSAAIDQGSGCPATDQRGIARPQGSNCDIGAFESRGFSLAISGGNNQSAPVGTAFADPLSVTVASVNSEPVNGGLVTFTPPASGASASLATNPAAISSGSASVTATANTTAGGSYQVNAYAAGAPSVDFSLTNTALPALSINDVTAVEGNSGTTNFQFTVSLSTPAPVGGVTFDIATADNTATAASNDYTSQTLTGQTIAAGSSSGTFTVTVNGDPTVESNESFYVNITNVTGATVTDGQGLGTITNDDTAGIIVSPTSGLTTTEAGGIATFTIVLTSQPTANVTIGAGSSDSSEGTVSPSSLAFTSVNWSVPQTVTVTGVDDDLVDGDQPYSVVTAAAVSADATYDGLPADDVSLTNTDDDTAGITVNPTSGLTTTEAGGTATFTIVLTSQPTANVTFGVSSSDESEGTVSPTTLTFTSANWSVPQTVTVTGVDDLSSDGDQAYSVITAAPASADVAYSGLDPDDVSLTNTDNDTPGITVSPTSGLTTAEAGGTAAFTIVLTSQPAADVTIGLASSDTSEGTVSADNLTFTVANWNTPQAITVTGVDDSTADGDVLFTIQINAATSADVSYNGMDPADVSVTNQDDDEPAAVVAAELHNSTHGVITFANAGDAIHVSASVTGNHANAPTGDVTFNYYNNVSCAGTAAGNEIVALASGAADMTTSTVLTADGLSFRVHYGGDTTYPAADGVCTAVSTSQYPTVLQLSANTVPYNGQVLTSGINHITVQFNMDVFHSSNSNQHSATYPGNYLLLGPGVDGIFNTSAATGCLDGAGGDDVSYTITSISYDSASFIATIGINNGVQLPVGAYQLYVCGSTSITDPAETVELNNGQDSTVNFTIQAGNSASSKKSVATGFTPGLATILPEQPAGMEYSGTDLWIEIPSLGIKQPIVGVPQTDAGWDVTWLGDEIGYLQGSAFPTWAGNSVLTGHVTGADGLPGVFADLGTLGWGDQIIIHAFGQKVVYEVRTVDLSASPDTGQIMSKHEDLPWLTLITCRGYDEKTGLYRYRTVVRAVQVSVEEE